MTIRRRLQLASFLISASALVFGLSGFFGDVQAAPEKGTNTDPVIEFFFINDFLSDQQTDVEVEGVLVAKIIANGTLLGRNSDITVTPGQDIELDGSQSFDTTGGTIVKYEWLIYTPRGDLDETIEGKIVTYTYPLNAGAERIPFALRITNDQGETDITFGAEAQETTTFNQAYVTDSAVMFEFRACDVDNPHLSGTLQISEGGTTSNSTSTNATSTQSSSSSGGGGATYDLERVLCSRWRVPHVFEEPGTYEAILNIEDANGGDTIRKIENIKVNQMKVNVETPRVSCVVTPAYVPVIAGQTPIGAEATISGLRHGKITSIGWSTPSGSCTIQGRQVVCPSVPNPGEAEFTVNVKGDLMEDVSKTCSIGVSEQLEIGSMNCSPTTVTIGSDGKTPEVTCTVSDIPGGAPVVWGPTPDSKSSDGKRATYTFTSPGEVSVSVSVSKDGQAARKSRVISIEGPDDGGGGGTDPGGGGDPGSGELNAEFIIWPQVVSAYGLTVFDAGDSTPQSDIVSYQWDLGCDDISTILPRTSSYIETIFDAEYNGTLSWPRTCDVTLTVKDDEGNTDSETKSIEVIEPQHFANIALSRVKEGMSGYIIKFEMTKGSTVGLSGNEIASGWAGAVRQDRDIPTVMEIFGADLDQQAQGGEVNLPVACIPVSQADAEVRILYNSSCWEEEAPGAATDVKCKPGIPISDLRKFEGTPINVTIDDRCFFAGTGNTPIDDTGNDSSPSAAGPNPFDNAFALTSDFATDRPNTLLYLLGGAGALSLLIVSFYLFRKV